MGGRTQSSAGLFSRERDEAAIQSWLVQLLKDGVDPTKVDAFISSGKFEKSIGRAIRETTPEAGLQILKALKRKAPAMLRERRAELARFEKRVGRTWKKPLDLMEMQLVIASEAGESVREHWPWKESEDDDIVFDVLSRLHVRGCQVAGEVIALLRTGFASGAHARWRALHETTVTALFIQQHGRDLAERYLLHEHVESYNAIKKYRAHAKRLGYKPLTKREISSAESACLAVVNRYGKPFKNPYGWAAAVLGREGPKDKGPSFADIEKVVELGHLRPHYQLASHPVHANPKAITFSLGHPDHRGPFAGRSNLGLTDPGHCTAISLYQLTLAVTLKTPTIDGLMLGPLMGQLVDDIGKAFLDADTALKKKVAARRQAGRKAAKRHR